MRVDKVLGMVTALWDSAHLGIGMACTLALALQVLIRGKEVVARCPRLVSLPARLNYGALIRTQFVKFPRVSFV